MDGRPQLGQRLDRKSAMAALGETSSMPGG